jgi:hypothetical protein
MDLIILLVLIAIVLFFFKDFVAFTYFLGIVEIFLRIINFIANHIGVNELSNWLINNFPSSIFSILANYSSGLLFDVLCWFLVICFAILEFHLVKYFIKRK